MSDKTCILCNYEPATMGWFEEDCCATCYWDRDAEKKRIKRANPQWQFQAAYSSAIAILKKSEEEAVSFAKHTVIKRQLEEGKTKKEIIAMFEKMFENFNPKDFPELCD